MKSSPLILLDANVILRFLRNDHHTLSPIAKKLFLQAEQGKTQLYLDEVVCAEVIWVLVSVYKTKREDIARRLETLIAQSWIINDKKYLLLHAIQLYQSSNFDYIDCWILTISKDKRIPLKSFDKNLEKHKNTYLSKENILK